MFLLSDFGSTDEFAGIMRAVIVREAPGASVVDLTHDIPAFDVRAGALALERAVPHLGPGVVVAVVDPGVGTERRALAISLASQHGPRFLVGPDNGVLCFAADALGGVTGAVALPRNTWRQEAGATFDGRDVFAPAGAHLWSGATLEQLGSPFAAEDLVRLPRPRLAAAPGHLEAEVLWVDRFGNVQLAARQADARAARLGPDLEVVTPSVSLEAHTAASFAVGDALGVITDSNGHLALVCQQRPAATLLGVRAGDVVVVKDRSS